MVSLAGVDTFQTVEDYIAPPYWLGGRDPAGVRERGMHTWGFPRNLGGPAFSTANARTRIPGEQPQARVVAFRDAGAKQERARGTAK